MPANTLKVRTLPLAVALLRLPILVGGALRTRRTAARALACGQLCGRLILACVSRPAMPLKSRPDTRLKGLKSYLRRRHALACLRAALRAPCPLLRSRDRQCSLGPVRHIYLLRLLLMPETRTRLPVGGSSSPPALAP